MDDESGIHTRFKMLAPFLNERTRRLFTAADAAALGRGGIAPVARATGVSRRAIATGLAELHAPQAASAHAGPRGDDTRPTSTYLWCGLLHGPFGPAPCAAPDSLSA